MVGWHTIPRKKEKLRGEAISLPACIIRPLASKGKGLLATTYTPHWLEN